MRRVHPQAASGLLLLFVSLAACSGKKEEVKASTGAQRVEAPPVQVCELGVQSMQSILEVTSRLESEREITLQPELSGTAIEILVEEGDLVEKGQVLARMDRRDETLALRDAEVALQEALDGKVLAELAEEEAVSQVANMAGAAEQAARDYGRDLKLSESRDVVSPLSVQALEAKKLESENALHAKEQAEISLRRKGLDIIAADTRIARAKVSKERAQLTLTKKDLVAPFKGVISRRNVRLGDSIGPSTEAFVLTDIERLRTVFSRPQEELALFAEAGTHSTASAGSLEEAGDKLKLSASAEAYPGKEFEGWVERISPTIDADSGQFRVFARLRPDPEVVLLPGMLLRMKIVTARHENTLVIPKRALRRQGDKRFVLVVDPAPGEPSRPLRRVDVREGFQDDTHLEVIPFNPEELTEGMQIVMVGSRELKDGGRVKVENSEPSATSSEKAPMESEMPMQEAAGNAESDVAESELDDASNG